MKVGSSGASDFSILSKIESILDSNLSNLESRIMETIETKLSISLANTNKNPILFFTKCDHCNVYPIKEAKFTCIICENYSLCPNCETKHNHPTIKFKTLDFSNEGELATAIGKKLNEKKVSILNEISETFKSKKTMQRNNINIDPRDILIDLPSEFFLVPTNTYFFIPFIITNNSFTTIPKNAFFSLTSDSDIFVENKQLGKDLNPGDSVQLELDCLSNKTQKSHILRLTLLDNKRTQEFCSMDIHVDVYQENK